MRLPSTPQRLLPLIHELSVPSLQNSHASSLFYNFSGDYWWLYFEHSFHPYYATYFYRLTCKWRLRNRRVCGSNFLRFQSLLVILVPFHHRIINYFRSSRNSYLLYWQIGIPGVLSTYFSPSPLENSQSFLHGRFIERAISFTIDF